MEVWNQRTKVLIKMSEREYIEMIIDKDAREKIIQEIDKNLDALLKIKRGLENTECTDENEGCHYCKEG